jgi:hypothetical protein
VAPAGWVSEDTNTTLVPAAAAAAAAAALALAALRCRCSAISSFVSSQWPRKLTCSTRG